MVAVHGSIDATLPIIMFCTIFGVSMDYEVFLLTRMREAWLETRDNRRAVAFGLMKTGRIITSAALIIVIVAGSFALTSILITKAIGVGLAVAIALDATVIRILLVPATMRILGRINWWIPAWLDRILPRLNVEGTTIERPQAPEPAAPRLRTHPEPSGVGAGGDG